MPFLLVVKAFGVELHLGFIVNRPSELKLGEMFPDHAPSREIDDPVFIGAPVDAGAIFALGEPFSYFVHAVHELRELLELRPLGVRGAQRHADFERLLNLAH
jgi:hypothetical protein